MEKALVKDEEDSILIQNLAIVELLKTLHYYKFLESDFYCKIPMQPQLKEVLGEIGINNTSTLLLMLYLLLVTAIELDKKGYNFNLNYTEQLIRSKIIAIDYNGADLNLEFKYSRFLRNSISHCNTRFKEINGVSAVVFQSQVKKINVIKFTLYTKDVGEIIDVLFNLISITLNLKYFGNIV